MTDRCPSTGKQSHPSKAAARSHLAALKRAGASLYGMHEYRCPDCKGWHVGHYPRGRRP